MSTNGTHPTITTTVEEDIGPEQAYAYLETAFGAKVAANRNVRQWRVAAYAQAMRDGRWRVTNQGIGFDTEGVLRDGQHRLWAVIESGTTVRMNVTRGLDAAAFDEIDTGLARSAADVLRIHGETNTTRLAGACVWQWRMDHGELGQESRNSRMLTASARLEVLTAHPGLRDSVSIATSFPRTYRRLLPQGAAVWLHYQFHLADAGRCESFFEMLRNDTAPRPTHPVKLLRERLVANMVSRRKAEPTELAALTVKAWNYYLTGEDREVLVWRKDEAFPQIGAPSKAALDNAARRRRQADAAAG